MADNNKNKIPQDNKDPLLTGTTLSGFEESPASAYENSEEIANYEQDNLNENNENTPEEQGNLDENEQQDVGAAMNQERQERSSGEPTKGSRQDKAMEERLQTLNSRLSKLNKIKLGAKLSDIWFFITATFGFTAPTIILLIPEILVVIPGIFILVPLGILKGPITKRTDKLIKQITSEIKEVQAKSAKNRQRQ